MKKLLFDLAATILFVALKVIVALVPFVFWVCIVGFFCFPLGLALGLLGSLFVIIWMNKRVTA